MSMFSALTFGARPFDLEATLASWDTSAPDHAVPEFKGKPMRKDDPSVEAWLTLVEQACSARRVPRTHWPAIAVHFMGKKPRGRVAEVEKVMRALHGEQWAWTWKSFSAAVLNMGCEWFARLLNKSVYLRMLIVILGVVREHRREEDA